MPSRGDCDTASHPPPVVMRIPPHDNKSCVSGRYAPVPAERHDRTPVGRGTDEVQELEAATDTVEIARSNAVRPGDVAQIQIDLDRAHSPRPSSERSRLRVGLQANDQTGVVLALNGLPVNDENDSHTLARRQSGDHVEGIHVSKLLVIDDPDVSSKVIVAGLKDLALDPLPLVVSTKSGAYQQ